MPRTATPSVSTSSPRGSVPSIHSNLMTIPSEMAPSERAPSERARSERSAPERPSVIITDDVNRLLQYLHGVENDRQRDNQGVHDHLGEIQNELRNLADYLHDKDVPPMELKDRSVGGSSIVSWREPRGAPDYPSKPPTVEEKASPQDLAIPLSPPPRSPRSPSSLSSTISFLSSHHSDDDSLMGSEPLETELFETEPDVPRESLSPISYSPPSSSPPSSPSSSLSSEILPLTPITRSPLSSGEYLSRTSSDATRRQVSRTPSVSTPSVSPTPSVGSSATVRAVPTTPRIDCEVINRIRDVLDRVKEQTDALWDGQLSTNHVLDELRQRVPRVQDNAELVERLQRLEDLINRLADAQPRARAPSPRESLFDSGSDTSGAIRRLRDRWDRMRRETPSLIAPTPMRPRTSLDDMMAELLRPPQPPAPMQIQPPPTFVPLSFRPDARGPRPRSASPTLLTELPPPRPFTVPIAEPHITRDIGRRRPSRPGLATRPGVLIRPPAQPSRRSPETTFMHDAPRRPARPADTGPEFLPGLHDLRGRRPGARPDGWIHSVAEGEPAATVSLVHI